MSFRYAFNEDVWSDATYSTPSQHSNNNNMISNEALENMENVNGNYTPTQSQSPFIKTPNHQQLTPQRSPGLAHLMRQHARKSSPPFLTRSLADTLQGNRTSITPSHPQTIVYNTPQPNNSNDSALSMLIMAMLDDMRQRDRADKHKKDIMTWLYPAMLLLVLFAVYLVCTLKKIKKESKMMRNILQQVAGISGRDQVSQIQQAMPSTQHLSYFNQVPQMPASTFSNVYYYH